MAASTRLRCYTPQGGASPLLSAEYRQTGTGSFHAWRSRATTAAVLSRAVLPRRSQLSVGCTGGSMFCDLSLAAAAAPMGAVRLAVALSCATSAANAGSGLIAPGSSQGGVPLPTALLRDVRLVVRGSSALVHVFARPGGGVRGRLLLWGFRGVPPGVRAVSALPCFMFAVGVLGRGLLVPRPSLFLQEVSAVTSQLYVPGPNR